MEVDHLHSPLGLLEELPSPSTLEELSLPSLSLLAEYCKKDASFDECEKESERESHGA
jgi:hypothetical protein